MASENETDDLLEMDVSDMSDEQLEEVERISTQETDNIEDPDNTEEVGQAEETEQDTETKTKRENVSLEDEVASLKKQITNLERIKNDRNNFVNKQNAVIRSLQNKLDSVNDEKDRLSTIDARDQIYEDPSSMVKNEIKKQNLDESRQSLEYELMIANEKIATLQEFPDYLNQVQDFVDYAKENDTERTGEKEIQSFLDNPFIGINKIRELMPKVLEYKGAKEKIPSNAKAVKKQKTSNKYSTSTSQNGGVNNKDFESITESDIEGMSDKELKDYISKLENG